ncbi:MAG: nitroreductase family protein [Deltaproteobacteria bacterium]|nr:nitroreductase family protein [Deltaproteobacteria bacterium]
MNHNSLKTLIKGRRSIRLYRPERVPGEKIMELLSLASYAPSSCNLQAWKFIVVDDDEIKKRIVRKGKANRQILSAPTVIVAAYNRNVTRENYANYQSLAALIQNFLLLAHSEGLGTLWVCNFKDEAGIRDVLHMPDIYRVLALIEVGYPKEVPEPPARSPVESFLSFNEFMSDDIIPGTTFLSDWRWKDILNWQERFARRGYALEKYTEDEKQEIPRLISPFIKNGKTLEIYTLSGSLTSGLEKARELVAHHFTSQDIYNAAIMFEPAMEKSGHRISNDIIREDIKGYSNFLLLNRLEHMPEKTIELHMTKLAESSHGILLIILFRNRYSWFGLYDLIVRFFLRKNGIDDIFFGTLRNLGPWKLRSRGEVKRLLHKYDFKIIKSFGLFCLPGHRLETSEWIRSKRLYSTAANLLRFIFSIAELFLKTIGLAKILGEQVLFICRLEKDG